MQFPDRSSRPQVSFKEMVSWNQTNRILKYASLIYKNDAEEQIKYKLIKDWQNVLSERWMDICINRTF